MTPISVGGVSPRPGLGPCYLDALFAPFCSAFPATITSVQRLFCYGYWCCLVWTEGACHEASARHGDIHKTHLSKVSCLVVLPHSNLVPTLS
jgi:hypothetical protein